MGWSHETWLFDALWTENGAPVRRGLCLRRDPGNALLRRPKHKATLAAMASADVGQKFLALGVDPVTNTPEEFAKLLAQEVTRWQRVVREAKIRPG